MFVHVFKNRLKCLLRNKSIMFWTLVFPLILATFFQMAFGNLSNEEAFRPVDLGVVNNSAYQEDTFFQATLNQTSTGDSRLFNLTSAPSREEAEKLLENGTIKGYFYLDPEIKLVVKNSGLSESIIKMFADEYKRSASAVGTILKDKPEALETVLASLNSRTAYVREVSAGSAAPNTTLNYFYALIAMACLYGSFFGLQEVMDIQANLSPRAARINVTPVHKLQAFMAGMSAALVIHFSEILVLIAYMFFAFNVDFGNQLGYVLLTAFAGSLMGLAFGAVVSAVVKGGEGVKVAILISLSMLASFLSGMMYDKIKYTITHNVPFLSYINPASLLTDAFYTLYYFDTMDRYWMNMGLLAAFIVLFCGTTYLVLRRRKYASL